MTLRKNNIPPQESLRHIHKTSPIHPPPPQQRAKNNLWGRTRHKTKSKLLQKLIPANLASASTVVLKNTPSTRQLGVKGASLPCGAWGSAPQKRGYKKKGYKKRLQKEKLQKEVTKRKVTNQKSYCNSSTGSPPRTSSNKALCGASRYFSPSY